MLNHNIKGTGLEVTPELRAYVEKKLEHINKFTHNDTSAHTDIELQFIESEQGKKFRAEFTLALSGDVHRSEARGGTMHEALDIAVGELTSELTKTKKKKIHILRRSAGRVKDYLRGFRNGL